MDEDHLNLFAEIFNEAEALADGQQMIKLSVDTLIVPKHKKTQKKGKA